MISTISKITDGIFMSGCYNLAESTLRSLGISFVVNCTQEVPLVRSSAIDSVRIGIEDSPYSNIGMYFDRLTDRIHETAKKGGKVLVHCVAGVSRSATLVIAYLVKHHNLSLRDAHTLVRSKRPIIRPNSGFWQQLVEFERQLRGVNSVKMVQTSFGAVPDLYQSELGYAPSMFSSSVSSPLTSARTTRTPRTTSPVQSSLPRGSPSYTSLLLELSRNQRLASQSLLYNSYQPLSTTSRWGFKLPTTLPPLTTKYSSYLSSLYRF